MQGKIALGVSRCQSTCNAGGLLREERLRSTLMLSGQWLIIALTLRWFGWLR